MKKGIELKTWDDVAEALNIDPIKSLEWADQLPEEDKKPALAFFKLSKLSKASYGDKQPNWSDDNEKKHFPYFDMDDEDAASGFGFSHAHYAGWHTSTLVGSRLVFPTAEMAEHAGTHFIEWYRDMMVLPK